MQLLRGFLKLQRAVQGVLDLPPAKNPQGLEQYKAVRDALMELVRSCVVPLRMALPLLFHVIPFLEARTLTFGVEDVQALIKWLTDVLLAHEVACLDLDMHERHIKDIRLALARALSRSHVYASAPAQRP